MPVDGPTVIDNLVQLSNQGTWCKRLEDDLLTWSDEAEFRVRKHSKKSLWFDYCNNSISLLLAGLCFGMMALSMSPWGNSKLARSLQFATFVAFALGQAALLLLNLSGRAVRHGNFAIRYSDMKDEIKAVLATPYANRPTAEGFTARLRVVRKRLHRF